MTLVKIENLKIHFDTDEGQLLALDDVSFNVDQGEILGIAGESGSGKSITAKSLMQLNDENAIYDQNSRVLYENQNLLEFDDEKMIPYRGKIFSMVFQEPMASFAPAIRIGDQMIEQLQIHEQLSDEAARQRSIEALTSVGIPNAKNLIDQYSYEFSGGMRQRAMIAMALSTNPKLLIADEPTTALDVTIQAQIINLIKKEVQNRNMGVIFITHDLALLAQTADRILIMYMGKIVESGTVFQVLTNPQHPYTKALIESSPNIENFQKKLLPIGGEVPLLKDRPHGCVFQNRCSQFINNKCDKDSPLIKEIEDNHFISCHLHHE
ncbi:ABC transporter ATP-binding protein [Alphaproteobacteria bacterium]|jgi:peptide/nickel transport system ATP-binding protein|nr:ABC transporter ATP-binding protein [Alphaproteobacteria bacterium]